uniref:Retrotransposon gag domain-containing protein n=1 Tax=Oryzias latipes TaxID=8090 RepID=A0A3P9KXK7_ORYLA
SQPPRSNKDLVTDSPPSSQPPRNNKDFVTDSPTEKLKPSLYLPLVSEFLPGSSVWVLPNSHGTMTERTGHTPDPADPKGLPQAAASGNNPTSADAMTPENFRLQPEPFSGDVAACGGFLLQCQLIFQQAPRFYQSDHSRISLIVNALRNKALQWAQAFLASNPISHLPFDRFIREFRLVFDQPRKQEEATRRLLSLKQGNRSVSEHLIDFRILAVEAGWPDPLRNLPLNPPSSPSRTKSNKPKVRYLIMLPVLLELYTYPTL